MLPRTVAAFVMTTTMVGVWRASKRRLDEERRVTLVSRAMMLTTAVLVAALAVTAPDPPAPESGATFETGGVTIWYEVRAQRSGLGEPGDHLLAGGAQVLRETTAPARRQCPRPDRSAVCSARSQWMTVRTSQGRQPLNP
jgi:hypothetical protein